MALRGDASARFPPRQNSISSARSTSNRPSARATPTRDPSAQGSARRSSRPDFKSSIVETHANAMKVYVRVRPFSEREITSKNPARSCVRIDTQNESLLTILDPRKGFHPLTTHGFTRCFWSVFENSDSHLLNKVDTYLIGGMNSARKGRAQSIAMQGAPLSAHGAAGKEAPAYSGAGSAPMLVDSSVSHPPYSSQADVYKHVGRPILNNTIDGYNGCIFAYGQTGSGKTFTMLGYAPSKSDIRARRQSEASASAANLEDSMAGETLRPGQNFDSDDGDDVVDKTGLDPNELQGIIPRTCTDLFEGLRSKRAQDSDFTYRVEVSYYEVYNEKVFDLIRPKGEDLKIRHGPQGPYIEDLAWKVVNKEEDVARVIRKGMDQRHTAATKFNDRSSRSHAILAFNIVQLMMDESDNAFQMRSKLNLVDLAGSERTGQAGAEGDEFHDGVKINQSLTVLGRVIDRLAELSKSKGAARMAVPYRESKLTWLLSDSIGGNSQTSMIATISPHAINFDEMKQTILYACRAQQVVNEVRRNVDPMLQQLQDLRAQVADLQQRLKEAGGSEYTVDYVKGLEKRVKELEKKVAEQERVIGQLRAELESAGIADPTMVTRAAGKGERVGGDDGAAASVGISAAAYRRTNDQLQSQLDSANREVERLQRELLLSQKKANDVQAADFEKQLAKVQSKYDALRAQMRERDGVLRQFETQHLRWSTDYIFDTFEAKANTVLRSCEAVLMSKDSQLMDWLNKGETERLMNATEMQKKHEQELSAVTARYRAAQEAIEKDYAAKEEDRLKRQREMSGNTDAKIQAARDTYEQEKKRWNQERDNMKMQYEEKMAAMRAEYQDDLKKLREGLNAGNSERQRQTVTAQELQDHHEAEMRSIKEDLDRERKRGENEMQMVKKQMAKEVGRKDEQLAAKDQQMKQLDAEASNLRRDNLSLQSELKKKEKELQGRIKELVLQQDSLVSVCNTVVSDYENKSSQLSKDIEALRDFIRSQDYSAFRAKAKEMAFNNAGQRNSHASQLQALSKRREKEAEEIRSAIDGMRKAQSSQSDNIQKMQREVYEQLSRTRGFQAGSEEEGLNGAENETNENVMA